MSDPSEQTPLLHETVAPHVDKRDAAIFIIIAFLLGNASGLLVARQLRITLKNMDDATGTPLSQNINPTSSSTPSSSPPNGAVAGCDNTWRWYWSIRPSAVKDDYCEIAFYGNSDVPRFLLTYPDSWIVRQAGAAGTNLIFNEDAENQLFLVSADTNLPLLEAYKEELRFESSNYPIVGSDEKILTKTILWVGEKQVLQLTTQKGEKAVLRYFLLNPIVDKETSNLHIFELDANNEGLNSIVQEMITQIRFIK